MGKNNELNGRVIWWNFLRDERVVKPCKQQKTGSASGQLTTYIYSSGGHSNRTHKRITPGITDVFHD